MTANVKRIQMKDSVPPPGNRVIDELLNELNHLCNDSAAATPFILLH